jgi:beta-lactamase superfamily II metal-dependent hydrolase
MPPSKTVMTNGNVTGKKLTVDVIDVGSGNCVLVTFPSGHHMLVDCGSLAKSIKGPVFKHVQGYISSVTGGASIDCIVMTHGERDHTAFIPYITEAQKPTYVHWGGRIGEYNDDLQTWITKMENKTQVFKYKLSGYINTQADADFGSPTTAGQAHVSVLGANLGATTNDRSIVLMIKYGDQAVILPGDASDAVETLIMGGIPGTVLDKCTVLMAGHHGSFTSTGRDWGELLDPDISPISASGMNMGFAHPDCATIDLLEEFTLASASQHDIICSDGKGKAYKRSSTTEAVFVTAVQGDIRYETNGAQYKVQVSSLTAAVPQVAPVVDPMLDGMVRNAPWRRDHPPAFVSGLPHAQAALR